MKPITLFVCTLLVCGCALSARAQNAPETRGRITATGEAVVYVTPDRIDVALGIETRDLDIVNAKQKNSDILRKTLAAVKDLGVPEKNIQTDHLSIEPRYQYDFGKETFLGYWVRNTLVVTLNDTGKIEDLLSRALQSGVNYIHGVTFQTTELRKYRDQARESALKAAREKAEAMARVLGRTVGAPVQISEDTSRGPWSYYSGSFAWGYGRGQALSQNVTQYARGCAGENSETIALGKIAVRADVSVMFELQR